MESQREIAIADRASILFVAKIAAGDLLIKGIKALAKAVVASTLPT
jgi:hypothetical protein